MKAKEHVLLASIFVTFIFIILYEMGVLKVEAPKDLFANGEQKALILKHNEETVVILPGTKMDVAWTSSEGELTQTGFVVYTKIDASLIYVTVPSDNREAITIPVDQIQTLIVQKGSRSGKYAKKGFWIGGATGALIGGILTEGRELGAVLLFCGLPMGGIGAAVGGIAGATIKDNITYPISPNDWEIVIK